MFHYPNHSSNISTQVIKHFSIPLKTEVIKQYLINKASKKALFDKMRLKNSM